MNENNQNADPLENELRSLRPRELSAGFMDALGERLEEATPVRPPRKRLQPAKIAFALASIAALVVAALWMAGVFSQHGDIVPPGREIAESDSPDESSPELQSTSPQQPTLLAYNRALGDAERDLDELLDFHARTLLPPVVGPGAVAQVLP